MAAPEPPAAATLGTARGPRSRSPQGGEMTPPTTRPPIEGVPSAGADRRYLENTERLFLSETTGPTATAAESPAAHAPQGSADALLRSLAPDCSPAVLGRLHRENIRTAADLARLDKQDLTDLGLSMKERSRVLAWARQAFPGESGWHWPGASDPSFLSGVPESPIGRTGRQNSSCLSQELYSDLAVHHHHYERHLEIVEQRADFWCGLACSWTPHMAARWKRSVEGLNQLDVRESLLESVFDLSQERVREVYEKMSSSAGDDGKLSTEQLRWGLDKYGLQLPNDGAVERLFDAVLASKDSCLQLAEFETVISRLTLAQIVMFLEDEGGGLVRHDSADFGRGTSVSSTATGAVGSPFRRLPGLSPMVMISVSDYSARRVADQVVTDAQIRKFFFGHRAAPELPQEPMLVRWIHLRGYNLNLLLGLTVKYNLHPLAVEDTIEQAPSKADRYGPHYFTTIEGLCLSHKGNETEPVRVGGYHVAVFCAGPPLLDTVITIAQEDRSFAEDWPSGAAESRGNCEDQASEECQPAAATFASSRTQVDCWADKIRSRLHQPLSRVRERRGDFLVYMVIDTTTDELMVVIRAYIARLGWLEARLGALGAQFPRDMLGEVVLIGRQLGVISRRVRGLTRAVKKFIEDRDIAAGLNAYLQDIVEHLDEVSDDCERLGGKCGAIADAYDRALDRERERGVRWQAEQARKQELRRAAQADRQNNILFVLTMVTTVFAPIQFLAGVYGMNFVNKNGIPTIPELLWKRGYVWFWGLVLGYLVLVESLWQLLALSVVFLSTSHWDESC
mmetsp:Transcript_117064/g.372724  ORF Transcript_117064/g.372724 Transcript_117064/m.372724 type:complete len:793 (-) Transcript_117064:28-2406(-)